MVEGTWRDINNAKVLKSDCGRPQPQPELIQLQVEDASALRLARVDNNLLTYSVPLDTRLQSNWISSIEQSCLCHANKQYKCEHSICHVTFLG